MNAIAPDYHKRLMLLTIACMLPDALGRLPVSFMSQATETELNLRIMLGLDLFIFVCVGLDTLWHRRLHPAFAWGPLSLSRHFMWHFTSRKRQLGLRSPSHDSLRVFLLRGCSASCTLAPSSNLPLSATRKDRLGP